jgi:hypothetical protein
MECDCTSYTLEDQIAAAECRLSAARDRLDESDRLVAYAKNVLANLKAEKAKQDAEKAKTVGEKMADQCVRFVGGRVRLSPPEPNPNGDWMPLAEYADRGNIHYYRRFIADAIDKAVADAKAEQRESDALIARAEKDRQYLSCGNPVCVAADIERHILEQK